jgi:hypothetical protein
MQTRYPNSVSLRNEIERVRELSISSDYRPSMEAMVNNLANPLLNIELLAKDEEDAFNEALLITREVVKFKREIQ